MCHALSLFDTACISISLAFTRLFSLTTTFVYLFIILFPPPERQRLCPLSLSDSSSLIVPIPHASYLGILCQHSASTDPYSLSPARLSAAAESCYSIPSLCTYGSTYHSAVYSAVLNLNGQVATGTTHRSSTHPTPLALSPSYPTSASDMSPTLWSGAAAVPGVLQLGRAQLWFGCILYFYCWTLTLMALISDEWVCSLGAISNQSCPQCPSWEHQHDKDHYQTVLLAVATVLGAVGYIALALRWLPFFARFPALKLLSVALLAVVIGLDFQAHYSFRNTYDGLYATSASSEGLFFCTAWSYTEIAAVYGCLTVGLLAWHEAVEWSVRRKMREQRERRRLQRTQQEHQSDQQHQQQGESDKPTIVVEQPGMQQHGNAIDKHTEASPSQLDKYSSASPPRPDPSLSSPITAPPPSVHPVVPNSFSLSSQSNGIHPSSSYMSSQPTSSAAIAGSEAMADGRPTHSSSSSSALVDWFEWLGLYTRPNTQPDSLLLKWTWKDQLSPMQRRLVLGINVFFLLLYFGGLIISSIEGWALQDGVNYILSSWCTLGYGLYTPITTGGRLFMYVYWPVGFIIISSTSTTIWRVILARTDRILRDATERWVARKPTAHQRGVDGSRRENGVGKQQTDAAHAHVHVDGEVSDEEEEEERNGGRDRHHNHYPALKDIVFNSPSNRQSSADLSPSPHDEPPEHAVTDASRRQPAVATHSRRASLPTAAELHGTGYAPSARYPLTWGRGNMSLTIYEAEHESSDEASPTLADVFAPLNSASTATTNSDAAPVQRAARPAPAAIGAIPRPSRLAARQLPAKPSPSTPTAASTTTVDTPTGAGLSRRGVSGSDLTLVQSSLRDDFLAHLRQQTSHEQLQKDIRHRRNSSASAQSGQLVSPRRLSTLPEEASDAVIQPPSPHSSASSHSSNVPPPSSPITNSKPFASAVLHSSPSTHPTHSPHRSVGGHTTTVPPLLHELAPLLVKLGIAFLTVICWICLAGGVFVWTEGGTYGYWQCQWSAFNILTTISVGAIATPFSTKTSAFFVWYLLLGVGTLAYSFALIAQLAFIALDKREAMHHQHAREMAHWKGAAGSASGATLTAGRTKKREAGGHEEEGFVAHAKELDSLILQLVQRQAANIESEEDAEKQHAAFMRSPVLMLGGGRAEGADERVEVPLEGVSLLLRYHLAFQAFEKERARLHQIRLARAARKARQQKSKGSSQQSLGKLDADSAAANAEASADGGGAQQQQSGGGTEGDGGSAEANVDNGDEPGDDDGDDDDDEEKLAGAMPNDRYFDWSNDRAWIAQAEQESVNLPADQPAAVHAVGHPEREHIP